MRPCATTSHGHISCTAEAQKFFRDWHAIDDREFEDVFVLMGSFTTLAERRADSDRSEPDVVETRIAENVERMEATASHAPQGLRAARQRRPRPRTPGQPVRDRADPGRWVEDGLFGAGLHWSRHVSGPQGWTASSSTRSRRSRRSRRAISQVAVLRSAGRQGRPQVVVRQAAGREDCRVEVARGRPARWSAGRPTWRRPAGRQAGSAEAEDLRHAERRAAAA